MFQAIKNLAFAPPPVMPHIAHVPKKFHPYIINHPEFKGPQELKKEAARLFGAVQDLTWKDQIARPLVQLLSLIQVIQPSTTQQAVSENKPYITTSDALPGYIIKQQRTDGLESRIAPDALLYRLRKAEKIRRFLEKENNNLIAVPQKFLYYDNHRGQWYLIAEKFTNLKETPDTEPPLQVLETLAKLAFETGLEDMHRGNIQHSPTQVSVGIKINKWCIVDTEPLSRSAKKMIRSKPFSRIWLDTPSLRIFFALQQVEMLLGNRNYGRLVQNPTQEEVSAVNDVKREYLQAYFKNSATKAARLILAAAALPALHAGLGGIASSLLLITIYGLAMQVGIILHCGGAKAISDGLDAWNNRHPWLSKLTVQPAQFVWGKSPQIMLAAISALGAGAALAIPYVFVASAIKNTLCVSVFTAGIFLSLQKQAQQLAGARR